MASSWRINKTEAAESIARLVSMSAMKNADPITTLKDVTPKLVDEVLSDCLGNHRGEYLKAMAHNSNPKTVRRLAIQNLRDYGITS